MEDIFYTNDHTGKYFPERFLYKLTCVQAKIYTS